MAGNEVTLTFAGDSSKLEKAFGEVGVAAKDMGDEVGSASKSFDKLDDASGSFEKAGRGLRDAITGTTDAMKGGAALLRGDFSAETFLTVGAGIADLGGAFGDLIIPVARATAQFIAHKAALVGHAIATGAVKVATAAWTVVQWALNAALTANPIGLIVVAIVALIAIIVLIATKTTWFQTIWKHAWGFIKGVAVGFWNFIKEIPGNIGKVFDKVVGFITAPFKFAFNSVNRLWNATVGQLRWTVPSWVPVIGGQTVGAPQLPVLHSGGIVPGIPGQDVLAVLQAGERVTPRGSSGGGVTINFGGNLTSAFATAFMKMVRDGDIQIAQA